MQSMRSLRAGALGLAAAAFFSGLATAGEYNITVDYVKIDTGEFTRTGIGYNGKAAPPTLRFKEGEDVTIHVTNNLDEDTSIHWHGLILPFDQDGVPGISYPGIKPGETFTYRFPITQSGTYWFHSHSGFQEPDGAYGALLIAPKKRETYRYDREYVVQFADLHPHWGDRIMRNLKMMPDYYNRKQRTLADFLDDAAKMGVGDALSERADWGGMRMMPTDIEDVQGFTPLINGMGPGQNWTGLFEPGERVRLRFINSSAMTYFDVRIPGLKLTVVQADGNDVVPVPVDELRIGVAETYDVIVRPTEEKAYTIFAESMGRTAFARGTLAPRMGMAGPVPDLRPAPLLTMADMALDPAMAGMDHGSGSMPGMDHSKMPMDGAGAATKPMDGMDHSRMPMKDAGASKMPMENMDHSKMPMKGASTATMPMDGMDHSKMPMDGKSGSSADAFRNLFKTNGGMSMKKAMPMDHGKPAMAQAKPGMAQAKPGMAHDAGTDDDLPPGAHRMPDGSIMGGPGIDPFYANGSGLTPKPAEDGGKFLSYTDLKAARPLYPDREATREIELRLTGNMERYIWSINGIKFEDAEPIRLQYGERVRFKFVNETMMTHPMHLHGMWSIIDNGTGARDPVKHVVSVAPGTVVYMETEVDAPGQWAFHCHLSYHADSGMFRKVIVEGGPRAGAMSRMPKQAARSHAHGG